MKRRLFNLLTYCSLLLGAVMALLWSASYLKAVHATATLAKTDWHLSAESGRVVAWAWPSFGSAAFTRWMTLYEDGTPSEREWSAQFPALAVAVQFNLITGGGWRTNLAFPLWLATLAPLLFGGLGLHRRVRRRGFEITKPPDNPPLERTAAAVYFTCGRASACAAAAAQRPHVMRWKKVLNCSDGFEASTGAEPDDDLAHVLFEDDDGYCLSVSRFPDEDDPVEVMVYDQIAHKTGDLEVELHSDQFRLTLSEAAAAELDGITEYVVPLSASPEQIAELDAALQVIFDGKHGGRYARHL